MPQADKKRLHQLPENIQLLLRAIGDRLSFLLGNNLVGIYMHGSIAMGCFNPYASDIDFLIVVNEKLSLETKKSIRSLLLELNQQAPPKRLETSIVTLEAVQSNAYPTPFELHFSKDWEEKFKAGKEDFEKENKDKDLPAHFMIVKHRGLTLVGKSIDEVFPVIPEELYLQSIYFDIENLEELVVENPVYGILNGCRVLAYMKEKAILSKAEGGAWGLKNIQEEYRPPIQEALSRYGNMNERDFDGRKEGWQEKELKDFAKYILGEIQKLASARL